MMRGAAPVEPPAPGGAHESPSLHGPMNLPDSETDLVNCLTLVGAGDRAAFGRLYDRSASQLFALALGICRRRALAEDVLQEAYVRIWRHAAQYDPTRREPMAWLATIVRRLAIDALRRTANEGQLEPKFESDVADPDPDPLVHAMRTQESRTVSRCLDQLEARQRSCILLAYFKGCSHTEVGARLGLPLGTVKSHIRRGLQRLKRCIGP
jgi:RNA polymerase sigma-70 factor, ECF subfamily